MTNKPADIYSYLFFAFILFFSVLLLIEAGNYVTSQNIAMLGVAGTDAGMNKDQFTDTAVLGRYLAGQAKKDPSISEAGKEYLVQSGYSYSAPKLFRRNTIIHFLPFFTVLVIVSVSMLLYQSHIHRDQRDQIQFYRQRISDLEKQLDTQTRVNMDQLSEINTFEENIYHQLKTPLTALSLNLEAIHRAGIASDLLQAYTSARLQAGKISRLITLLLNDSRCSCGKIRYHYKFGAVDLILADAISDIKTLADNNHIKIATEIDEGDFFLKCDEIWLKECFVILLENAAENVPENGEIRIGLERHPQRYVITICSRNVTFMEGQMLHMFERYYSTKTGHFGIGLHLARSIVREMKADNSPLGALFSVSLPVLDSSDTYLVTSL